jgi:hypothetical protein
VPDDEMMRRVPAHDRVADLRPLQNRVGADDAVLGVAIRHFRALLEGHVRPDAPALHRHAGLDSDGSTISAPSTLAVGSTPPRPVTIRCPFVSRSVSGLPASHHPSTGAVTIRLPWSTMYWKASVT